MAELAVTSFISYKIGFSLSLRRERCIGDAFDSQKWNRLQRLFSLYFCFWSWYKAMVWYRPLAGTYWPGQLSSGNLRFFFSGWAVLDLSCAFILVLLSASFLGRFTSFVLLLVSIVASPLFVVSLTAVFGINVTIMKFDDRSLLFSQL